MSHRVGQRTSPTTPRVAAPDYANQFSGEVTASDASLFGGGLVVTCGLTEAGRAAAGMDDRNIEWDNAPRRRRHHCPTEWDNAPRSDSAW